MENIGQANVFHEFLVCPRFLADPRRFSGKTQIHGKHWPGQCFPLFFSQEFMENIGQANVFHEFLIFPRFLADPRRFSGKPQIHGKHWPGQCFPLFFHRNSWKTLAWPMFSMNFWCFLDSWVVSGDSLKNHGKHWPGQCFPWLFHRNSWKTLAWPMFSMNLWFSRKSSGWSQEIL